MKQYNERQENSLENLVKKKKKGEKKKDKSGICLHNKQVVEDQTRHTSTFPSATTRPSHCLPTTQHNCFPVSQCSVNATQLP